MKTIPWRFEACARIHKVTIREIAHEMRITLKRVREVRDMSAVAEVSELTAWEFIAAMKAIAARKREKV